MRPRRAAVYRGLVVIDRQARRRQLAAVIEDAPGFPTAHKVNLIIGFGDAAPAVGAVALLPEPIELIQRGFAGQAALDQEAADHCAGAADSRPTVHVHTTAREQRVVEAIEDLGHVHPLRRYAVILDGLTEVLDAEGQLAVIRLQLTGLGEVDETLDARVDQTLQPLAGRLDSRTARMLSGQDLAG